MKKKRNNSVFCYVAPKARNFCCLAKLLVFIHELKKARKLLTVYHYIPNDADLQGSITVSCFKLSFCKKSWKRYKFYFHRRLGFSGGPIWSESSGKVNGRVVSFSPMWFHNLFGRQLLWQRGHFKMGSQVWQQLEKYLQSIQHCQSAMVWNNK